MARTVCWLPLWSEAHPSAGLEHVLLTASSADSALLAIDDDGEPLRLTYALAWDEHRQVRQARLEVQHRQEQRTLTLQSDGAGHWHDDHGARPDLDGCIDIDIWPTPLTNSLPLWRSALQLGERREYTMAWIAAPKLTVQAKRQAYTRLAERRFLAPASRPS